MHAIKSMSSKTILAGAIALAAACSGQKAQPVDAGLANDLSLASTVASWSGEAESWTIPTVNGRVVMGDSWRLGQAES